MLVVLLLLMLKMMFNWEGKERRNCHNFIIPSTVAALTVLLFQCTCRPAEHDQHLVWNQKSVGKEVIRVKWKTAIVKLHHERLWHLANVHVTHLKHTLPLLSPCLELCTPQSLTTPIHTHCLHEAYSVHVYTCSVARECELHHGHVLWYVPLSWLHPLFVDHT